MPIPAAAPAPTARAGPSNQAAAASASASASTQPAARGTYASRPAQQASQAPPAQATQSKKRKAEAAPANAAASSSRAADNAPPPMTQIVAEQDLEDADDDSEDEADEVYVAYSTKVVGVRYYTGMVGSGELVSVVREPTNQYDSSAVNLLVLFPRLTVLFRNAIRVLNAGGTQVGHIPKTGKSGYFVSAGPPFLSPHHSGRSAGPTHGSGPNLS